MALSTDKTATPQAFDRYSDLAIVLHWGVAGLIGINLLLVWFVESVPESFVRPMINTHKSFGLTVLGLVILRVLWRFAHRPPALPDTYPAWEKQAAHFGHLVLYFLMFALPLSGWMHDSAWKNAAQNPLYLFYTIPFPRIGLITALDPETKETMHTVFGLVHTAFAYGLYALLAAHIGGALKHQYLDKEPELERMWFAKRR